MLHAVKTSIGSYKIVDGDGTHVIMTREEFEELQNSQDQENEQEMLF